ELAAFDLSPAEVSISGPAGLVARTAEIGTDTIELSGKKSDFTVNVRLLRKESLLTLEDREAVVFTAKIRKSLDVMNFVNITILPEGLLPSLSIADMLPTGQVRMRIPEEALAGFDQKTLLSIDLSAFTKPGTYVVDVIVKAPDGAVMETYEPQSLTVSLQSMGAGGRISGSIAPLPQ
ncbi:MAG: CdaR family protein, partial [Candidatus Paceibacterota bacterium]